MKQSKFSTLSADTQFVVLVSQLVKKHTYIACLWDRAFDCLRNVPSRKISVSLNCTQKRVPELRTAHVQGQLCCHPESSKRAQCSCMWHPLLGAVLQVTVVLILHTPSQSSVPPTLFQDSSAWCDLSSFEFFEEAAFSPSQHHTGKALHLQQREEGPGTRPAGQPSPRVHRRMPSEGSLGPARPLPPARHSTIPLVILRKKRGQASPLATGDSSSFLFADVSSSTPKRSPVKSLPFSPSQVETISAQLLLIFSRHLSPNNLETNPLEQMTNYNCPCRLNSALNLAGAELYCLLEFRLAAHPLMILPRFSPFCFFWWFG